MLPLPHPHPVSARSGEKSGAKDSDGKQAPDLPLSELAALPGHVRPHFFQALVWANNCFWVQEGRLLRTCLSPAGRACRGSDAHCVSHPDTRRCFPHPPPLAVLHGNWPNKRQKQECITPWAVLKTNFILRNSSSVYWLLYI